MKRSWFGFLLLIALLLGCLLVTEKMGTIHEGVESKLLQSAQCAMEGSWHRAEALLEHAETDWQKNAHFRGCFADHNPVEDIDAAFAMLQTVCTGKDAITYAASCRSLARQVAAVGEAHELVWWNLF